MSYIVQKQLPTGEEVTNAFPLTDEQHRQVSHHRQEICDILSGKDPRKLLIIGPCSAWPNKAVLEYAQKLKELESEVSDTLKIVMRCYIQKPRTRLGWLGPMNQPNPYGEPDLEAGIYYCREMTRAIVQMGLAVADEALFTHNDGYAVDLLSWVAIGARSSEDQEHRLFASMIPHPVGIKNPTSGNISIAINSIIAAQNAHVFALHRQQVQTSGNPYAHLILRGGSGCGNYSIEHLQKAAQKLQSADILNPAIIVDASHENSVDKNGNKQYNRQPEVIWNVLDSSQKDTAIADVLKGFMVESFLTEGSQKLDDHTSAEELTYGQSVTDGCLGWIATKDFIRALADRLR